MKANEKVRPHFWCLPEELFHGQAGEGGGFLKRSASSVSQLWLESWRHGAVCFGQMRYTETVVGQCQGSVRDGAQGPCAFSTERKVFFTGGVGPRAASRSQR